MMKGVDEQKQKFLKFKETEKVWKKMSARADHICKTPPGWNKDSFGSRNQRVAILFQHTGPLYMNVKSGME